MFCIQTDTKILIDILKSDTASLRTVVMIPHSQYNPLWHFTVSTDAYTEYLIEYTRPDSHQYVLLKAWRGLGWAVCSLFVCTCPCARAERSKEKKEWTLRWDPSKSGDPFRRRNDEKIGWLRAMVSPGELSQVLVLLCFVMFKRSYNRNLHVWMYIKVVGLEIYNHQ